jgi:hypothetical protein
VSGWSPIALRARQLATWARELAGRAWADLGGATFDAPLNTAGERERVLVAGREQLLAAVVELDFALLVVRAELAAGHSADVARPMHSAGAGALTSSTDAHGSARQAAVQSSTSACVDTDSSRQFPPASTAAAQHAAMTSASQSGCVNPASGSHSSHREQSPTANPEQASRTVAPCSPPPHATSTRRAIHRIE